MRREVIRVATHVIIPMLSSKIIKLNQSEWKNLHQALLRVYKNWDVLLERFEVKMEPKILSAVLEIQDKITSVDAIYQLIPDVLGVPDNELNLLVNSESVIPFKNFAINSTAKDLVIILQTAISMLQSL